MTETPRRWRFQFSLRTLILAVVGCGLLWLFTLKTGGNAVARAYALANANRIVQFTNNDGSIIVQNTDSNAGLPIFEKNSTHRYKDIPDYFEPRQQFRGTATAIAPFVILWRWDELKKDGTIERLEPTGLHLWLPGWRYDFCAPELHFRRVVVFEE